MNNSNDHDSPLKPAYWDTEAATFDDEADHGLTDPTVRTAWRDLLVKWMPPAPASVLDAGCGTGSLSVLLAGLGYDVTGIDLSPEMINRATTKARASGLEATFHLMDAGEPGNLGRKFDAVICRHLLWTMADPANVLSHWSSLLAPGGRLVLVEGFWHTGAGLHVAELLAALPSSFSRTAVEELSSVDDLWGGPVDDERYIVVAHR